MTWECPSTLRLSPNSNSKYAWETSHSWVRALVNTQRKKKTNHNLVFQRMIIAKETGLTYIMNFCWPVCSDCPHNLYLSLRSPVTSFTWAVHLNFMSVKDLWLASTFASEAFGWVVYETWTTPQPMLFRPPSPQLGFLPASPLGNCGIASFFWI